MFDLFYTASARGIHLNQQSSYFNWKLVLTWRDYGKCLREPVRLTLDSV